MRDIVGFVGLFKFVGSFVGKRRWYNKFVNLGNSKVNESRTVRREKANEHRGKATSQ